MPQANTKKVSLRSVVNSRGFGQGFRDVREGRGWNPPRDLEQQDRYERGRLFAVACPHISRVKENRRLAPNVMAAFRTAYVRGDIL